jgi:hypothetical protein
MSPHLTELPVNSVNANEFVVIYLLQNNGSASREDIEAAYKRWNSQPNTTRYRNGRLIHFRRGTYTANDKNVWQIIKSNERYDDDPVQTTSAGGKGWWWSTPGINKGALLRLTPRGAAAAIESLQAVQAKYPQHTWNPRQEPPEVKKSPPPRGLNPNAAPARAHKPSAQRGQKTTYKIYGRFKGHPAATRLKGQAYVAPNNTKFRAGDQAEITVGDNGKLRVKKPGEDYAQLWDPIDG